ncbi:hypothetical protein THIOSC15_350004 [uncultured Thiomicrorhabdus sp.]
MVIGNAARIRSFFNEKQVRKRQEQTIVSAPATARVSS